MIKHDVLAHAFVDLADTLVADFDVTDFLHVLTDTTVQVLEAQAAGLVLVDLQGTLQVGASTGEVDDLELAELATGEGPCLDCFATGQPVTNVPPQEIKRRWPRFYAHALRSGYVAVHSLPMRLRQQTIGAVNIYFANYRELDPTEVAVCRALADVATIGILQERIIGDKTILTEQLQSALSTRVVIEQAKGVLAERTGAAVHEAFSAMRQYARSHGSTLRSVAEGIIAGSLETADWQIRH